MKKQLFALSVLALGAMPAMASNFYLAADVGRVKFSVDSESRSDTSFSLGAGYKFNQYFAVELAYRDMGELSEETSEDLGGGDFLDEKVSLGFSAIQASVVASYPLGETSSLYGRLGVSELEVDASYSYNLVMDGVTERDSASGSESENKAFFGVGYSHSFTPALAARIEYNQYEDVEDFEISTATVGLSYQF